MVISWLFHFNILNSQNIFLWRVFESFKKITDPPLNYIRKYLPNLGGLDISPVLLILIIYLFKDLLIADSYTHLTLPTIAGV